MARVVNAGLFFSKERMNRTDAEKARDVARMLTPHQWPAYPLLPLKRAWGYREELGFLIDQLYDGKVRVHLGNIWGGTSTGWIDYESFEAVVEDGWEID